MDHSRVVRKSRNTGRVLKVLFVVGTHRDCELWLETFGAKGCTRHTWNGTYLQYVERAA